MTTESIAFGLGIAGGHPTGRTQSPVLLSTSGGGKTDEALKALVAEHSLAIRESRRETDRLWREIRALRQETDRLIGSYDLGPWGLGDELGVDIEDLFRPLLERAMREQFGMTVFWSPMRLWHQGEVLEIDVVAHAGSDPDEVYLAKIRSRLRHDDIGQILDDLRQFPRFFPEHRGKRFFGILAALEIPEDLRAQVIKKGLYLATIKDDVFEIVSPDGLALYAISLRDA